MISWLGLVGIMLALVHFTIPLVYYMYAKNKWLSRTWEVRVDERYRPSVTVIIPTYNEAKNIRARLENILGQEYPKDLVEVIVVDSGSNDGTAEIVEKWINEHRNFNLRLIREEVRRGKAQALNVALNHAHGDVIVIADADASWPVDALSKVVLWLSDSSVGAVSCLKRPLAFGKVGIEEGYRKYYNVMRVAESKAYSTPIFHGELAAFKSDILRRLGGFPNDVGADDSYTAIKIALLGYRAITPDDLWVEEKIPRQDYFWWRVRRAQHLIQSFAKSLKTVRVNKKFGKILLIESYLHLFNPWVLVLAIASVTASAVIHHDLICWAVLASGVSLMAFGSYRTWIITQLFLIIGSLRNIYTKEIVWKKQYK